MITRRSMLGVMLGVMLAAACGPAIVRASSLMAVKPVAQASAFSWLIPQTDPWKCLDIAGVVDETARDIAAILNQTNEILRHMEWRTPPLQRVALPA